MRKFVITLAMLCFIGCAAAAGSRPSIALITTDNAGGWLLFTDQANVASSARLYVLATDQMPRFVCCAQIQGAARLPGDRKHFFIDVLHVDHPTAIHVFRVALPAGAIPPDNPNAMAVWGVTGVSATADGYALHTANPADHYTADACFGSEGINLYLRDGSNRSPPVAHYYGNFGYDIGPGDCPEQVTLSP
jgi:hypothetical protein